MHPLSDDKIEIQTSCVSLSPPRHPLVKEEPAKPKSDVELPPAVSSLGYLLEEENLYKDG